MTATRYDARELDRAACLALLPTAPFGRLVFTEGALPSVLPVNFAMDGERVVIRTREGASIAAAVDGAVVAFQADDIDPERRTGWTVTAIGSAAIVRNPLELERLAELPLVPWAGGDRNTFVVVEAGIVSGRRIGGPEPTHTAGEHTRRL